MRKIRPPRPKLDPNCPEDVEWVVAGYKAQLCADIFKETGIRLTAGMLNLSPEEEFAYREIAKNAIIQYNMRL